MQPSLPPQYHFMLIAPNLGAEYLFDAARLYWERFHPTVISNVDFLPLVPADRTVTVTVIARRDTIAEIGVEVAQAAPQAVLDLVVFDRFEETKAELDRRAELMAPFGAPVTETAVPMSEGEAEILATLMSALTATPASPLVAPPEETAPVAPPTPGAPLPTPAETPAPITRTPGAILPRN